MTQRPIAHIVLHCTATDQEAKVSSILNYWKNKLGWKNPGYHFLIDLDGRVSHLQPLEKPSNGVRGYNKGAIHISYIGGIDLKGNSKDTRTAAQHTALESLVKALHGVFPAAKILGHRDFKGVHKDCPSFDVAEFLEEIEL